MPSSMASLLSSRLDTGSLRPALSAAPLGDLSNYLAILSRHLLKQAVFQCRLHIANYQLATEILFPYSGHTRPVTVDRALRQKRKKTTKNTNRVGLNRDEPKLQKKTTVMFGTRCPQLQSGSAYHLNCVLLYLD